MSAGWPTLWQLRGEFGALISGMEFTQKIGRERKRSTLRLTPDCTRLEIVVGTDPPTARRVVELGSSMLGDKPKKKFWQRKKGSLWQMVSVCAQCLARRALRAVHCTPCIART